MGSTLRRKYAPVICTALFGLAILVSALIGNMIVTNTSYAVLTPDYASLSLYRGVEQLTSAATASSMQVLAIFLAGFSYFALPVAAFVALWRGVAFGYAASVIATGRLKFSNDGGLSVFGLVSIPPSAVVLIMYFLTSAMLLLFMSASVSFAGRIRSNDRDSVSLVKRYTLLFFVISGACALCDIIKSLII